jgi:hypothetical protein
MTTFIWSWRQRWQTLGWLAAVAFLGMSIEVSAQTSRTTEWQPGSTLGGFVGASSTASGLTPAAGNGVRLGPSDAGRPVFEDLLHVFGGGADVFVTSHLALRPEVALYVITPRADRLTRTVYGVHLAYHFEARGRP